MNNKFLFFDFKRSKVLNILIVFQVALWLFYTASLISLLKYNSSFKEYYSNSLPVKSAQSIEFYKMMAIDNSDATYAKNKSEVKNIINYLDTNNYQYGLIMRDNSSKIPLSAVGIGESEMKSNYSDFANSKVTFGAIQPIYMNYGMIESYSKRITTKIDATGWNDKHGYTPVIVGSNFSERFKVNDTFTYNNIKYVIKGFFKKDTLAFDYTSIINSSFLLNNCFVIPFDQNTFLKNFDYQPISVYFNSPEEINFDTFKNNIEKISSNATIVSFNSQVNDYLNQLSAEKMFQIIRVLMISFLATASLITVIIYKLSSNKDRIGILYSCGISKNRIFSIISEEFLVYITIGILCGSFFYFKNCKDVYMFFINQGLYANLLISVLVLVIIFTAVLSIGLYYIDKLSPKEMIGGFAE